MLLKASWLTNNTSFQEHLKVHSLYEDEKGIEYLGQMIEGTFNSPHYYYYGSLFHYLRMMLGHMMDPFHKHGVSTQHNWAIY